MRLVLSVIVATVLLNLLACSAAGGKPDMALEQVQVYQSAKPYDDNLRLRVDGRFIVNGKGEKVRLKGVAFGNEVWANTRIPSQHHNEQDYIRLKEMGFNSIRFYLNYQTFESDSAPYKYHQSGWDWLDKNVQWAEKHGIYLVLNIHVPQGGFQSNGAGDALWDKRENQLRLISLWQAIAKRYQGHPNVAALDLLNEPVTTRSKQQWEDLANELVTAIRQVNQQQMIFVERLLAVKNQWQIDEQQNFFKLADPNVVYQYHFYEPMAFSHQQASWLRQYQVPTSYPDPDRLKVIGSPSWYGAQFDNPTISADSDWQFVEGKKLQHQDPKVDLIYPALVSANNAGDSLFKQVVINEYAPDGKELLREVKIDLSQHADWYLWSANQRGRSQHLRQRGEDILQISATTSDANNGSSQQFVVPKVAHFYQISGWVKTRGTGAASRVQLRLDFQNGLKDIVAWDKQLIEKMIEPMERWGEQHQVPLYLGEFGCIRGCFELQRGGLQWVSDVLDVVDQYQTHFNFHSYHEDAFALYYGYGSLPTESNANQPLIQLFKQRLNEP
ncbi:glycoside hydrolase family 5 protein [Agarivorans aestuarii]|uniref:glycoside hydrolase family 5 protein n=1 Tax=Agarivorans aestuarii TaxID=1563703 RepID=UPI001C7F1F68|nr:cellulase family glycosylhydrolase [Agarivorans aestuarii]